MLVSGREIRSAVVLAVAVCLFAADSAMAYVGPGAGIELVGSSKTLLVLVGIAIIAVLLWPLSALVRRLRGKND
jgi:hypothetical protein